MAVVNANTPLVDKTTGNQFYPLTSYNQVIMEDGGRWDGKIPYNGVTLPDGANWDGETAKVAEDSRLLNGHDSSYFAQNRPWGCAVATYAGSNVTMTSSKILSLTEELIVGDGFTISDGAIIAQKEGYVCVSAQWMVADSTNANQYNGITLYLNDVVWRDSYQGLALKYGCVLFSPSITHVSPGDKFTMQVRTNGSVTFQSNSRTKMVIFYI